MKPEKRAREAANDLADAYSAIGRDFAKAAGRLRSTPITVLAAKPPPPYRHRSTRSLEDALDEALAAL